MNTQQLRPKIRFKEFDSPWYKARIDEVLDRHVEPVEVSKEKDYRQIGIRSHGKGIFYKEKISGKQLGKKRVFWLKPDLFVVNIVFAWEQAIAKTTKEEEGLIASHRFPQYIPINNKLDLDFILYFFLRKKGKYILELASPGGAGRNKTLGQKEFAKSKIQIPQIQEQKKIASFLSAVDKRIDLMEQKKAKLEEYKKGVMQQIFKQEIRFKGENEKEFPEWNKRKLGDILNYEQPTKYLVNSTEYEDRFETPVLTAGKTFILGYTNETEGIFTNLPVIIFDDFTTAFKYVDFPFKAKSSAMKMLIPNSKEINLKFVYEAMGKIKFPLAEHKRYWISEFQHMKIHYPCIEEQNKIAAFLTSIDKKIEMVEQQIEGTNQFKKGLLQKMFI